MEENTAAMNNETVNQKPHPLTALAFLEVGLFEVGFVIIGLLLFFGTLNYFNILPVSETFPKYLGWLPRQHAQPKIASQGQTLQNQYLQNSPQNPDMSAHIFPTATPIPNSLISKAKTLGYDIININQDDVVGRTTFYENKTIANNGGIGIKKYKNINGKEFIAQIVGSFENLKDIANSLDKYLILKNPITNKQFSPVRILLNTPPSSSSEELSSTYFIIEDLNYNGKIASLSAQNLGTIGRFSKKEIEQIFHKGDAVAVGLATNALGNVMDQNQQLESLVIFIRRFGGKEEVEKEIGRKI